MADTRKPVVKKTAQAGLDAVDSLEREIAAIRLQQVALQNRLNELLDLFVQGFRAGAAGRKVSVQIRDGVVAQQTRIKISMSKPAKKAAAKKVAGKKSATIKPPLASYQGLGKIRPKPPGR